MALWLSGVERGDEWYPLFFPLLLWFEGFFPYNGGGLVNLCFNQLPLVTFVKNVLLQFLDPLSEFSVEQILLSLRAWLYGIDLVQ